MGLFPAVLAAALSAGIAQFNDQVGVYGHVNSIVLEPNSETPERVQLWGTFSVAAPEPGEYHVPERGYLYFALPVTDLDAAHRDWKALESLAGRYGGFIAFARRGGNFRVRTSNESPCQPTPYSPGDGVVPLGYRGSSKAMQMLGSLLKPKSRLSYARVDEVVFEPNAVQPERIQISGVFVMEEPSGAGYAVPRRGYLYLTLPSEGRDLPVIRHEWNEWKRVAGTRQVVRFYTALYQGEQVRVRAPDEEPSVPDATPTRLVMPVRSDTEYAPVKALLEFD